MNSRKGLVLLAALLVVLIGGCGKKCCKKDGAKLAAFSDDFEKKVDIAENIPVVDDEMEDFFDDEAISEFAFLDEDFGEEVEEDSKECEACKALAENEISDLDFSEEFCEDDYYAENEAFVSWDEEDPAESIAFKTVHFDLNKNNIRKDQKEKVVENIELAKIATSEGKTVVVQGHCCQEGPPSFNLALSKQRAEIIKKEMINNGIPAEKIKTVGCGQEMPVVWSDKSDKKERIKELAPNRRSEVLVES